jgi:hypothetical protein
MSVWYEIVVTGTEDAVRRFVAASERALGGREAAVFGHDLDLEASPISQRLRGLFAGGSRHVLFAASGLAERIIAGLRDRGPEVELGLESVAEIVRARLPFTAEAFSREVADAIRQELLESLPPGVERRDLHESEEQDASARGAELYTPEHAYVYRAAGNFVGPLPGIIEMRRRARNLRFVKVKALELETRPVEKPGND